MMNELIALVAELAADLEGEIEARYAGTKDHPAIARRYGRDMEPVRRARAYLATLTKDTDHDW